MKRITIHRHVFIALGIFSLALGFVGILVPVLPTTPFILMAAALFLRSSEKLHRRLLENKILGKYLSDFSEQKGMTLKGKIYSITVMWTMILVSGFFVASCLWRIILLILGGTGTLTMGFLVKTVNSKNNESRYHKNVPVD